MPDDPAALRDQLLRHEGYSAADLAMPQIQATWVYQTADAIAQIAVVVAPIFAMTAVDVASRLWAKQYHVPLADIVLIREAVEREWDALQEAESHAKDT